MTAISQPALPLRPLMVWALAVPCALAGVTYAALGQLQATSWELELLPIYLIFIAEIAALGAGVAWGIPHRGWRWLVFLWLLLLINLLLYSHASLAVWRSQVILRSLWAAQASALIIWAVGATAPPFYWRYPAAALVALPFVWQIFTAALYVREDNSLRIVMQWAFLALLLGALRWRSYAILPVAGASAGPAETRPGDLQTHQFGLRHLLVWMTSISLLLAAAKSVGLFQLFARAKFGTGGVSDVALTAIVTSCLMLIALWAALGAGSVWIRWPIGLAVPFLAGLGLEAWDRWLNRVRAGRSWSLVWMIWCGLASGMLVALLAILRGEGYRLVRSPAFRRQAAAIPPQSPQGGTTNEPRMVSLTKTH